MRIYVWTILVCSVTRFGLSRVGGRGGLSGTTWPFEVFNSDQILPSLRGVAALIILSTLIMERD